MAFSFIYPRTDSSPPLNPAGGPKITYSDHKAPSNIKLGSILLPAFIVIIMFGPFAMGFIGFVAWTYTVKRYQHEKQLVDEEAGMEDKQRGAEMQVRSLVEQRTPPRMRLSVRDV